MTDIKSDFKKILTGLTEISLNKKYWFVRTMSGDYYPDFLSGGFIAIGYNEVILFDINSVKIKGGYDEEKLAARVLKSFPEETRPKYIATQLIDFVYSIQKGDIVVIPSDNSSLLSFAEVIDGHTYIQNKPDSCPFVKRKKVKYLKTNVPIDSLDPRFYKLKYTQRTVSHIDSDIIPLIDSTINTLYIKNKNAHLALDIRQRTPIKATHLFETWLSIFQIAEDFSTEYGLSIKKDDFEVKLNLQSPGSLEFISYVAEGIILISIILAALVGADLKAKFKEHEMEFHSEGWFEKYNRYLNSKIDRKLKQKLIDKLGEMDIKPEDINNLLKQLQKNESTRQLNDTTE